MQSFLTGATLDDCLDAYHKHHDIDKAVMFLRHQKDVKDSVKFRERIATAAAKTMYEAAGLAEPGIDGGKVMLNWRFLSEMVLEEDEEEEEDISNEVEGMDATKNPVTSLPTTMSLVKYVAPKPIIPRDVFGRKIIDSQPFQQPTPAEKTAMEFKARIILEAAFKPEPMEMRMCEHHRTLFKRFADSNPLGLKEVELETVDRYERASSEFRDAFPATTLNKLISGHIIKLKNPANDGTLKLRLVNVSASPLWSGSSGIHTTQDKDGELVQFNTLSPEEIHLGDYYHHKFNSRAPHQFVYFPMLPPHIQDQIWECSFESRIVEIHYTPNFASIWSPAKLPPQFLVSKEANAVVRRRYEQFPFGTATAGRKLLFNFDIDVMFLTYEKQFLAPAPFGGIHRAMRAKKQDRVTVSFLRSLPRAQVEKVRHLALDRDIWEMVEMGLMKLLKRRRKPTADDKYVLPMFTGLESFRIVENCNLGFWRINTGPSGEHSREDMVPSEDLFCGSGIGCDCGCEESGDLLFRLSKCREGNSRWWKRPHAIFMEMMRPEDVELYSFRRSLF